MSLRIPCAPARTQTFTPCQDPDRWDAFVQEHPKGSIFHTSYMYRVYDHAPNHQPYAVAARDAHDNVLALLMAVRVSVVSGIASYLSSRSIMFAEVRPIEAPGEEREVLEENGYVFDDYLNYVVDVSVGVDSLWNNLGKSTRNNIRKSYRRGVEVTQHATHASIDRMYALVSRSYQRSQVPLADLQLFHAALDHFPSGVVQVRIATYQGRDVAAGIGLMYRNRFYAWYGGSVRIAGLAPFDCLTWEEIRWTGEHGGRYYDFGGAGWPNERYGPREFKAKFRGDLLHLGRYRRVYSPWRTALACTAYQALRGFVAPNRTPSPSEGSGHE